MDPDVRKIVLEVQIGDKDSVETKASVVFCESSASLQFDGKIIHIPWSELALWQAWLAQRVEQEA